MAHKFTLPEEAKIVGAMKPATDAAGRTGRYVNAGLAEKIYVVFHIDQGNAATIALGVNQATTKTGTSAKAVAIGRVWSNLDLAANPDNLARAADGLPYTTDAGVKEKVVVLEVDPAALDTANGFVWIAPTTGASNVANLTECAIYATPVRYSAAAPGINIAQ